MSEDPRLLNTVDICPTCGAHSVKACRDSEGAELHHDHAGRPQELPHWLGITKP